MWVYIVFSTFSTLFFTCVSVVYFCCGDTSISLIGIDKVDLILCINVSPASTI